MIFGCVASNLDALESFAGVELGFAKLCFFSGMAFCSGLLLPLQAAGRSRCNRVSFQAPAIHSIYQISMILII